MHKLTINGTYLSTQKELKLQGFIHSPITTQQMFVYSIGLEVPDPGMSGYCPGKIPVNCAYCFVRKFSCDIAAPLHMSPAR